MYILISTRAGAPTAELREADNCRSFRVVTEGIAPSQVGKALSVLGIGGPHTGTDVCVATEWIRSQGPVRNDAGWANQFQSMLDYAEHRGWTAEAGRFVIAHIDITPLERRASTSTLSGEDSGDPRAPSPQCAHSAAPAPSA